MTKKPDVFFKAGVRKIPAPVPNGTFAENLRQMMLAFPVFRWSTLLEEDGAIDTDGSIVYELQLPPAKANG